MKSRWKTRYMLFAAVWLGVVACGQENAVAEETQQWSDSVSVGVIDRGWKFEAWLYKPKTAWCEPIYFRTTITNISNSPKPFPHIALGLPYLGITIRDSAGERMPFMRPHIDLLGGVDTTLMLASADSSVLELDLLWLAPRYGPSIALTAYRPGEYTLEISLYLDSKQRASRLENTLVLPPLTFTVVEPTGDSAEALRLLNEATYHRSRRPDYAEACYDSILALYSNTPYDELTNIELIYFRSSGPHINKDEYVRWAERYFLKYTDTPYALSTVGRLISRITPERMQELVAMVQVKPNTARMIRHLKDQHPWIFEDEEGE